MIELWYYVKSDFFKLRNSLFFGAHILFPISGVALVLLYAVFAAVSDINKIAVFFQLFAIAYPFVISIVCEIAAEQEIRAGHCQNILVLRSRTKAILSKFLLLIFAGLFAILFSTFLLIMVLPVTGTKLILPVSSLMLPVLTLWSSNILLYAVHIILAFRFGRTICIGIGAIGSLLAALLQTGLGTGLWFVLPYGFGIRLTDFSLKFVLQVLPTINAELKLGIGICLGMTVLFIAILLIWFSKYGGKCAND